VPDPANDTWSDLIVEAQRYLDQCQRDLRPKIGSHERFDHNVETGTLVFSAGETVYAESSFLIAGTFTETTRTWLWSWASPLLPANVTQSVSSVREHGFEHEFEYLSEESFELELDDAWLLAGIACYLLGAEGVYRALENETHSFLLPFDTRVPGDE